MKNKKGMTITEIVVSVVLVSIVLVFLLNLLITVKKYTDDNQSESNLLINQSIITKEIEKDIKDYSLSGISTCTATDLASGILPYGADQGNLYCLKLVFDNTLIRDNVGYLLYYTYNFSDNNPQTVIGYKRGDNQVVRQSYVDMNPLTYPGSVTSSCTSSDNYCSLRIVMPIVDDNLNDYSITISYIYKKSSFIYTTGSAYGFSIN